MNCSSFLRVACATVFVFASTLVLGDEAAVARQHKVNAPVGLVIRSKPSTTGKRLGAIEEGTKVTLAGKAVEGDKTKVVPVVSKDDQDIDASWIQITAPKAGYVLYRAGGSAPYEYLVPVE